MCRWACASGRPAVPQPLSSLSSGPAAPRWCCWDLGRPSQASPWVSCCSAGRTQTPLAKPQTAGRAPPGTWMSPYRWGSADRGIRRSCTWTSPSLWSPAWSALHMCLKGGGQKWDSAIRWLDVRTAANLPENCKGMDLKKKILKRPFHESECPNFLFCHYFKSTFILPGNEDKTGTVTNWKYNYFAHCKN